MGDRIALLKDGILQQCATPREMYDRPNNVFVAGFIGSPAMNLVSVTGTETACSSAATGSPSTASGSARSATRS